ncbi:MAG: phosphatidate cytidylyltransferase [Planctomycetes bacterium]|nr:phosphatidate cytidylyltransferase [Planctomycetota bacterium]
MEPKTLILVGVVLILLAAATAAGQILRRRTALGLNPAALEAFGSRVRAWWLICAVVAGAFLVGKVATVVVIGLISFWALREFITLTPTRPGDHRALFWVFVLCTPLQYVLVGMGEEQYGLYSILIPVYAFLFIPARIAMAGDYKRFLERAAKIQAGLLICVYCFSYAAALLTLDLGENADPDANERLLFFFVVIVQLSDVLQYAWSKLPTKHVIVPTISPTKTWEGLIGGTVSAALVGAALAWATPFEQWWMAAVMSTVIALMGFAGSLTMSAIKRDRGVRDYGTLVEGHGGALDRIDSICFAAPVFFHLTRYYLTLVG